MTREEIKKALEMCADAFPCEGCPYDDNFGKCVVRLKEDARSLIIKQEKEIERLNFHNGFLQDVLNELIMKVFDIDACNGWTGSTLMVIARDIDKMIEEVQNAENKS